MPKAGRLPIYVRKIIPMMNRTTRHTLVAMTAALLLAPLAALYAAEPDFQSKHLAIGLSPTSSRGSPRRHPRLVNQVA